MKKKNNNNKKLDEIYEFNYLLSCGAVFIFGRIMRRRDEEWKRDHKMRSASASCTVCNAMKVFCFVFVKDFAGKIPFEISRSNGINCCTSKVGGMNMNTLVK